MLGESLASLGLPDELPVPQISVKVPVFPFVKFPGVDVVLGPEMKSTGEVMGTSDDFGAAFAKGQIAAGHKVPTSGTAFLSVNDNDKPGLVDVALRLSRLGFDLIATKGTAAYLESHGLTVERVLKVNEGRPNIVDMVISGKVDLVVNTPLGRKSFHDEKGIRETAVQRGVICITTLTGANATVSGIEALQRGRFDVRSLQEIHHSTVAIAKQDR
jgi:carbamoyl-phosphate synthase large subunit